MEAAHRRIRRDFISRIEAGELEPGDRLPTEHELCERYGVSRTTVGKAMSTLVADGYITRTPGVGSRVRTRNTQMDLMSFADPETATLGHPGAHKVISSGVVRAAEAKPHIPGVRPDEAVIVMQRSKLDTAYSPIAIERHAVPFSVAPDLLSENLETLVSLRYLREIGATIATIRVYLIPHNLTDADAELLGTASGIATLIRRRELRDRGGDLVEVVETIVRPGTTDFYLDAPGPDA